MTNEELTDASFASLPLGLDALPPLTDEDGVVSFIWKERDDANTLRDFWNTYPDKRFNMTRQTCMPGHLVQFSYYTLSEEELQREQAAREKAAREQAAHEAHLNMAIEVTAATPRTIIEAMADYSAEYYDGDYTCQFCGLANKHYPDCPVLLARLWLAAYPEPTEHAGETTQP